MVFADSSAIVKLYADESGAVQIRELNAMYVSELARVEVPAALWRKHRMGALTASGVVHLLRAFDDDFLGAAGCLAPVALTPAILDAAARATGIHGLRAYDAVHLATAAAVRTADPQCSHFACFNNDLRVAALREGFTPLP
ncbi:MAG: type II toxin-antitoxin system VapC family toxin [Bifidobacteriaceae bacterium]|jgi:predicted nucleic acid-binding protein|nr:type II toxin-antitoxin system VapC family toxin [Bifidobacteriaceae bacterium]